MRWRENPAVRYSKTYGADLTAVDDRDDPIAATRWELRDSVHGEHNPLVSALLNSGRSPYLELPLHPEQRLASILMFHSNFEVVFAVRLCPWDQHADPKSEVQRDRRPVRREGQGGVVPSRASEVERMEVAVMDDRDLARELHDHRGDADEWEDTPDEVKVQPARSEVVSFRLSSDHLNEIEALATRMGQSISEFVRNAVLAYVRGEVMTPVLDVQAGGPGRLQFTMRTRLPSSAYTSSEPPEWIPSDPITTVTCID